LEGGEDLNARSGKGTSWSEGEEKRFDKYNTATEEGTIIEKGAKRTHAGKSGGAPPCRKKAQVDGGTARTRVTKKRRQGKGKVREREGRVRKPDVPTSQG